MDGMRMTTNGLDADFEGALARLAGESQLFIATIGQMLRHQMVLMTRLGDRMQSCWKEANEWLAVAQEID